MAHSRFSLLLGALVVAGTLPALAQSPPAPGGSDVAATLQKAGVRPTPDAMTGRDEKTADDAAYKVEESSGLPRELRDLKDQQPPDPQGLIRRLGLHDEPAVRVDFRNRTPTAEEIVQALRPSK
jgi:hypothetical protein